MKTIKTIFLLFALVMTSLNLFAHNLEESIKSEDRTTGFTSRDIYRHPYETLSFFGIKPDMTLVELNPGGGWYTEILANYIHYPGTLIAAQGNYYMDRFQKKMESDSMYGRVEIVSLNSNFADPNSVDAVLTFRNLHNWLGPQMDSIFKNSMAALKPGGVFGIVEHRAKPGTS